MKLLLFLIILQSIRKVIYSQQNKIPFLPGCQKIIQNQRFCDSRYWLLDVVIYI